VALPLLQAVGLRLGEGELEGQGELERVMLGDTVVLPERVAQALALPLRVGEGEVVGEREALEQALVLGLTLALALPARLPLPLGEREGEEEVLRVMEGVPVEEALLQALTLPVEVPVPQGEAVGAAPLGLLLLLLHLLALAQEEALGERVEDLLLLAHLLAVLLPVGLLEMVLVGEKVCEPLAEGVRLVEALAHTLPVLLLLPLLLPVPQGLGVEDTERLREAEGLELGQVEGVEERLGLVLTLAHAEVLPVALPQAEGVKVPVPVGQGVPPVGVRLGRAVKVKLSVALAVAVLEVHCEGGTEREPRLVLERERVMVAQALPVVLAVPQRVLRGLAVTLGQLEEETVTVEETEVEREREGEAVELEQRLGVLLTELHEVTLCVLVGVAVEVEVPLTERLREPLEVTLRERVPLPVREPEGVLEAQAEAEALAVCVALPVEVEVTEVLEDRLGVALAVVLPEAEAKSATPPTPL
jgi:hypothetical protein